MSDEQSVVPSDAQQLDVVEVRTGMFGTQDSGDTSGFGGLTRIISMPTGSPPPFGGWYDEVAKLFAEAMSTGIENIVFDRGELTFYVQREQLLNAARTLRDDPKLRFEFISGVSGVHYPQEAGRELHAVYHLISMTHNRRIRMEVTAPETDPHIPSIVSVYPAADWHERETYDMFGIIFDGHPALTRILLPDDWEGHPQRKDYPLGGIPVEYKGGATAPPHERRSYN